MAKRFGLPFVSGKKLSGVVGGNEQGGVIAAARRLTEKDAKSRNSSVLSGASSVRGWQEEAWELLDLIGEQRFLSNVLAGQMSRAALYVGKTDPDASPGTRPEKTEDTRLNEILAAIGSGPSGLGQILSRYSANMFVAGECWLVGIPPYLLKTESESSDTPKVVDRKTTRPDTDLKDMDWRLFSTSEITVTTSDTVSMQLETGREVEAEPDELYMIRIWRPHPRKASEADSPTRASLPVLRELAGLTMHIGAQIDSRLAGAGMLLFDTEASAALKRAAGLAEDSSEDPLVESLATAMMTPIEDRSSASALVPLVVTVPNPKTAAEYITFSTELDKEARQLREEAIRRLALSQDAPPELLLGTGSMNHWGAWLVMEETIQTHLVPPLALFCDALTEQYLRPIMEALGYEDVDEYAVWYDVDHLVVRPNRMQDAKDAHSLGIISDSALRDTLGFDEADGKPREGAAEALTLELVSKTPSLAIDPGLPALVEQIRELLDKQVPTEQVPQDKSVTDSGAGGLPGTYGDPADIPEGL